MRIAAIPEAALGSHRSQLRFTLYQKRHSAARRLLGNLVRPKGVAVDAAGNIYIIEDRNGGVDNDIWFARDLNKDGDLLDAGEGIGRWASNGVAGSENSGLYFDKFDPNVAYVNIQHPSSGVDRLVQISAVPEPETYAMMLAGLFGLGFIARRRRG